MPASNNILTILIAAISTWVFSAFNIFSSPFLEQYSLQIKLLPVFCLILFGVYSALFILWQVFSINNCKDARDELEKDIVEAREELKAAGFVFDKDH